jgi:AcrR family transcriptional regulator
MPRHVDLEQRRQAVAEAVWRVVRRSGLAAASVRAVAEEAGLSVGSLRHYFGEQRELQVYAFRLIIERYDQRLAEVDPALPLRERIEQVMWALLPVTPAQVEEEQVRLEFLVQSRIDPRLSAIVDDDRAQGLEMIREMLRLLREAGQCRPDVDVEATAVEFLALLDGLAQAAAINPAAMPGERLQQASRRWLDNLAAAR